jgi:electron transport complex protein RnfC
MKQLIVDCTGDDPYNESRAVLCHTCAGDVVGGAKILMKLLTVRQTVFSVSVDRNQVVDELNAYIPAKSKMLRTEVVRSKFPQSVPHLLVSSLFDLEINSGIPMGKTGYTVVSPMLCKAVFDALAKGIPYTDATVTLAEEPLTSEHIRVLTVPIGTPLSEVLTLCGRTLQESERLTTGGGYRAQPAILKDLVTAETEAVSLLAVKIKKRLGICIGCGRCGDGCPMRLNPAILYEAAMADRQKAALRLDIDACIGCGTCTASCPAGIPLAETITAYRAEITGGSDEG